MEAGERKASSPILRALFQATSRTTGEIRVHLSKRWIEQDPFKRACRLFERYGMSRTRHRNAVLIYVNLRKRQFAIIGDKGIDQAVGPQYWNELGTQLREDLLSTHPENAIALAVLTVGASLQHFFPVEE